MELIKIDFSQHNGPIKNMDAVNNGPTAPSVRTPTRTNFELYKNAGLENLINDLISGGAQKESVMLYGESHNQS